MIQKLICIHAGVRVCVCVSQQQAVCHFREGRIITLTLHLSHFIFLFALWLTSITL